MVPKQLAKLPKNYDTKLKLLAEMTCEEVRMVREFKFSLNQELYKLYHLIKTHINSFSINCPNFMVQKQIQVAAQANM